MVAQLAGAVRTALRAERAIMGNNNVSKKIGRKVKRKVVGALSNIHPAPKDFLNAIINPCDRGRPKSGLPQFPLNDSFVARGFVDFTMTTGSAGSGFISLNPTLANDQAIVNYSNNAGTYAGSTINTMNAAAVGTTTINVTNLPYASASFVSPALLGRIVACGLSIKSSTASLYEQGVVQLFADPAHGDIGTYTSANLSSRQESTTHSLKKGEEYTINTAPVFPSDSNYVTNTRPYLNTAGGVVAGILVTGAAAANPVTFLCRLTIDVEYVGTLTEHAAKPKPVPPAGTYEHCAAIAAHASKHRALHPGLKPTALVKLCHSAYKAVNSSAGKSITAAFSNLLL